METLFRAFTSSVLLNERITDNQQQNLFFVEQFCGLWIKRGFCFPKNNLTSLEVVLELISHTTTNEGLTVRALKDSNTYPTGRKVTDDELAALNLLRDAFYGE